MVERVLVMKHIALIITLALPLLSTSSIASEHTEKMCEKIRECALGEIAANQVPDQMKDLVIHMINSQCDTMAERYDAEFAQAGLRDKAEACVDSIVVQECDALLATKGRPNTQACVDFEQAANDAGIQTQ